MPGQRAEKQLRDEWVAMIKGATVIGSSVLGVTALLALLGWLFP